MFDEGKFIGRLGLAAGAGAVFGGTLASAYEADAEEKQKVTTMGAIGGVLAGLAYEVYRLNKS